MIVRVAETNTERQVSWTHDIGVIRPQQPVLHKRMSLGLALWKHVFIYMTIGLRYNINVQDESCRYSRQQRENTRRVGLGPRHVRKILPNVPTGDSSGWYRKGHFVDVDINIVHGGSSS